MQSILQYRRLRSILEEDVKRSGSRTAAGRSQDQPKDEYPEDIDDAQHEKELLSQLQQETGTARQASEDPTKSEDGGSTESDEHRQIKLHDGRVLATSGIDIRDKNDDKEGKDKDEIFLVGFDSDDDPLNPKNWKTSRKWSTMAIVACTGFAVGWASSIDSAASTQAMETFHVSKVAESLATALFLIAFGVGSLVAGPFSETVGRNITYLVSLTLFMIFTMASGLAPNFGAQLAFRFIAGFFACTPLTTFGGSMADLFLPVDRVYVFPVCGCLSFLGPFLAPMVGAFIGQSTHISWRWTEWTTLILTGLITISIFLFVPETYAPILLKWKAQHLRSITGDTRFVAEVELNQVSFAKKLLHNTYRPLDMLIKEVMVALFTVYLSIVYIVLFGFLVGYDFIFGEVHSFTQGEVGLTFIGMNVGFLVALAIVPFIYIQYRNKLHRLQKSQHNDNTAKLEPEQHLWYAMLGAPWLPISLFWMAWTSRPSISYWVPLIASIPFGFSVQAIFISTYQYLIDSYEAYAASALVTCVLLRYMAAGAMQIVSIPMYENLGVNWTLTLLGCLAAVMTPVPYVFYVWGGKVRERFSHVAAS